MRKLSRWMTAVCATALLTGYGGVAWAQEPDDEDIEINVNEDEDVVDVDRNDEYGYDVDDRPGLMSGFGTSAQIGGGVFGFTSEGTDDFMDTGGSWTARLVFGTRMPLALEAAYIGTANNISALGLDEDAVLLSNGAEANLRWNILSTLFGGGMDSPIGRLDPYVFSGIGYRRYSLINDDFNTSSVNDSDNVGEVPFGGGVAWSVGGFVVDARGEYRLAFNDELFAGETTEDTELNTWNVSARLGWEF